jgi:hypothetical protein
MDAAQLKQKLHDYINTAGKKKLQAIYTLLESDMPQYSNWWDDKEFVEELDRRAEELESGRVKGLTWEESIAGARKAIKRVPVSK